MVRASGSQALLRLMPRFDLGSAVDPKKNAELTISMLRGEDGSLAFRHELARRAFEDSLSQARQQSLHAKVLSILATRPDTPPARLAHHADGARNVQDVLRFATLAASTLP